MCGSYSGYVGIASWSRLTNKNWNGASLPNSYQYFQEQICPMLIHDDEATNRVEMVPSNASAATMTVMNKEVDPKSSRVLGVETCTYVYV